MNDIIYVGNKRGCIVYINSSEKKGRISIMSKRLVAYFSATGTTKKAAIALAEAAGAELYEITPAVPYTAADLNWMDKNSRSSVEMRDHASRPAIEGSIDIREYDTIFLGFPIWWYIAPTIINTFLESYDFSGKTIIPFATSGGSGMGKTVDSLKESYPGAVIKPGRMIRGAETLTELREWVKKEL